MDSSTLSTGSSTGAQTATQNPQTAEQSTGGGTSINRIQPNISISMLNSNSGVALYPTSLPTVSLTASA
ncbi:MAG: hypothetical protein ACREHG_05310, partial [Candidatus Saccharimonadales bacterium]